MKPISRKTHNHFSLIRKGSPVTIAFGFTFNHTTREGEDGKFLMLGSDSRISKGTTVIDDETKIVDIQCDGICVLVAKAGYKVSTDQFEELFRKECAESKVVDYRTIPDLAHKAMSSVRRSLLEGGGMDASKQLEEHYCECVLGFFHKGLPYLYSIDLRATLANRCNKSFIAVGDGSTLADFLFSSVDMGKINVYEAVEMGVSVVEMCKLHNASCGGPCRLASILSHTPEKATIGGHVTMDAAKKLKTQKDVHKHILKRFGEDFRNATPKDRRK